MKKYIAKNIKMFVQDNFLLFFLVILSIISSCIMIHFAYGLFQNYQLKKEYNMAGQKLVTVSLQGSFMETEGEYGNTGISLDEPVDHYVTVDLMREYAKGFGSRLNQGIKYIQVGDHGICCWN